MQLTRRMRLIWHKLWLIPLVGATADVVASEWYQRERGLAAKAE